jgi:proline iminopeptidase
MGQEKLMVREAFLIMKKLPPYSSVMTPADWKYPQPPLRASGWLEVQKDPVHNIYWEEYGKPDGETVMVFHGGPGGGTNPSMARYFDPDRYRIILFDQRGCGKSIPNAKDTDAIPALADNTTPHLIDDVNRLRDALGIKDRMHVFGGSWGSTLALAYAIDHPDKVRTLILRGIFLCRRKELDYFYQGNAAAYDRDPFDSAKPGAYLYYPEAWKAFVEIIPPGERDDMIRAYSRIFAMNPETEEQRARLLAAASAWTIWEGVTSYLAQDISDLGKYAEPDFAMTFARIENHYYMNGAFLGGSGERNRDNNYLLENADKLRDIPVYIVHGRFDVVSPMFQADELVRALQLAGNTRINLRRTPAGHSMNELMNNQALTAIMDELPRC